MSAKDSIEDFSNNLAHSRAAYLFAVRNLPNPSELNKGPITANGFRFERRSQVESMLIELGWAFFCRYESCLEAFLKRSQVELSQKCTLSDWLSQNNVSIPTNLQEGLEIYRKIRNKLHHEDGASLDDDPESEIHLMPDHMNNFYELFLWCGTQAKTKG